MQLVDEGVAAMVAAMWLVDEGAAAMVAAMWRGASGMYAAREWERCGDGIICAGRRRRMSG